jgi:NAD(P)-dependent dehydrogenase (short-subunit alcohol dehydrogenase family)
MSATIHAFGRLDVLHNNAGVHETGFTSQATSTELPEDVWDKVIAINLKGPWMCSKYAAPLLKDAGGGVIVNAASIGGLVGYPMGSAYGPSKAGIVQLTRVMALELAPQGTRVVCYAPGNTETPMVEKYYSDPSLSEEERRMVQQQLLGTHLIPRLARPEEVADLVIFLASDQAAMLTGTCVTIDAGTLAWRGLRVD